MSVFWKKSFSVPAVNIGAGGLNGVASTLFAGAVRRSKNLVTAVGTSAAGLKLWGSWWTRAEEIPLKSERMNAAQSANTTIVRARLRRTGRRWLGERSI